MIGALISLLCAGGMGYLVGYSRGRCKGYDEGYNFSEKLYQGILEMNYKTMKLIRGRRT